MGALTNGRETKRRHMCCSATRTRSQTTDSTWAVTAASRTMGRRSFGSARRARRARITFTWRTGTASTAARLRSRRTAAARNALRLLLLLRLLPLLLLLQSRVRRTSTVLMSFRISSFLLTRPILTRPLGRRTLGRCRAPFRPSSTLTFPGATRARSAALCFCFPSKRTCRHRPLRFLVRARWSLPGWRGLRARARRGTTSRA